MKRIEYEEFGGERPLFAENGLHMEKVTIHVGESALKRGEGVIAKECTFDGKYPFWHCRDFQIRDCLFTEGARAAIWYSEGCRMSDCTVEAPKMFREMQGIEVERTDFPNGQEMLWNCRQVRLHRVKICNCDYLFSHSRDIAISDYEQHGNYSFQYCKNVRISHAKIYSKDSFWNTENVTIIDSEVHGEYLGWYSSGLTLINCIISGTQPLCYAKNLAMVNCVMEADCDLCFEESELRANVTSPIASVKNPRRGSLYTERIGEVIIDRHSLPDSDFKIITER